MARSILFNLLLFLFCYSSHAQQDSLLLAQAKQWSAKAWSFYPNQPDSISFYLNLSATRFKEAEAWPDYIATCNGLTFVAHRYLDDAAFHESAQPTFKTADQYLDHQDPNYAIALNNYAIALRSIKGDYDKALELYEKSVQIQLKAQKDKTAIASTYQNISVCYRSKGDFDEGIEYLKKAKQYWTDTLGENSVETLRIYMDIGHIQRDQNRHALALKNYKEFLNRLEESQGKVSDEILTYCYQSMSKVYTNLSHFDSAQYYLDKTFAIHQKGNKARVIQTYETLGHFHEAQSNQEQVIAAYQKASELAIDRYQSEKTIAISRPLWHLGKAYQQANRIDEALKAYQRALIAIGVDFEDEEVLNNPELSQFITYVNALDIITSKASTFRRRYDTSQDQNDLLLARQHHQLATRIINAQRRNFLADGSKHTLAAKALTAYEGAIETALLLHQLSGSTSYLEEAFGYAERNKSMLLLESMQENMAKVAGQLSKEDLQQEKELNIEMAFLEKQLIAEKRKAEERDAEKIKNWENKLFDTRQQYQKLVASFEEKYPDYYQLKHKIEPASVEQIRQQLLQPDMALIEYFVGKEHIYVFGIGQDHIQVEQVQRTASLFNSLDQLTTLISQPPFQQDASKIFQQFGDLSWALAQQLFLPLKQQFPAAVNRLIIIPDDQLAYLPFELLLSQAPASAANSFSPKHFDYLLKQYAISYNYSATLLLNHLHTKTARHLKPIVGFAPAFADGPIASSRECHDGEVYGLQCNGEEVKAISQIFNGQVQEGAAASIEAFKTMAKDYRIIHLATHACAGESDAFNKIYFSDGFLTNFDLNHLELNAELAVLSACNTGSGQLVKGEGVMSLSRGFILANCPSTLMSLWTVDDCITSELMVRFYEKIKKGLTKDEALRQAKIEHLEVADKTGLHPYYWAAFLQSGNAAPLSISSSWNYWWGFPAMLIFMLLLFWRKKRRR